MCTSRGFTLLELLVVIGVATILLTVAVPGFSELIEDNRRAALLNEFVTSLQLARVGAVMDGHEVTLCKSADGAHCAPKGARWDDGWIVFANLDGDDPAVVDPGEQVLIAHPGVRSPLHVAANREYFSFRPYSHYSVNGTVTFCDDRGSDHAMAVIISAMGRPRVSHTQADGSPINCSG